MPKKSRKLPAATTPPEISSAPAPELAGMLVRLYCLIYDGLLLVALWMITAALLVPLATPEQAAQQHQLAVTPESFRQLVLFPALVIITWLFYGYFWVRS